MSFFGVLLVYYHDLCLQPVFFQIPTIIGFHFQQFYVEILFWETMVGVRKMRKKHGKIDICHAVIFRLFCLMTRFVPIIRGYFCLLIITAIR